MNNGFRDFLGSVRLDSVAVNLGVIGLNLSLDSGSGHSAGKREDMLGLKDATNVR